MLDFLPGTARDYARLAAIGWLIVAGGAIFQGMNTMIPWETVFLGVTVLSSIVGLLTVIAIAKWLAGTELSGLQRSVGLAPALLGLAAIALINWATVVWTALLTIAILWTTWLVWSRSDAPATKFPDGFSAFALAWPLGAGLFILLNSLTFGPVDEYGDYPWAAGAGIALWCVLFAWGLYSAAAQGSQSEVAAQLGS